MVKQSLSNPPSNATAFQPGGMKFTVHDLDEVSTNCQSPSPTLSPPPPTRKRWAVNESVLSVQLAASFQRAKIGKSIRRAATDDDGDGYRKDW